MKEDFVWQRLYENIGTTYVQILDYLGMIQEADQVFSELLKTFPTGIFIGIGLVYCAIS